MRRQEILAILLSVAAFSVGLYFGIFYNGLWFSRSGSVIVCIAIIFVFIHIERNIKEFLPNAQTLFMSARSGVIADGIKDGMSEQESTKAADSFISDFFEYVEPRVGQEKIRSMRIEVTLLLVGTLIWGFGDLINQVEYVCG